MIMKIVPKERKFNGNNFDTKIYRKMFEKCQKIEKIRFFAAYTTACLPARLG